MAAGSPNVRRREAGMELAVEEDGSEAAAVAASAKQSLTSFTGPPVPITARVHSVTPQRKNK
eukprot:2501788-Pyramimonas_sp.AAC.1